MICRRDDSEERLVHIEREKIRKKKYLLTVQRFLLCALIAGIIAVIAIIIDLCLAAKVITLFGKTWEELRTILQVIETGAFASCCVNFYFYRLNKKNYHLNQR